MFNVVLISPVLVNLVLMENKKDTDDLFGLMNYYMAILQYDGSDHMVFQWQENIPKIQSDLNLSWQKILRFILSERQWWPELYTS